MRLEKKDIELNEKKYTLERENQNTKGRHDHVKAIMGKV